MHVPDRDKTYLRNRMYMKLNPKFEYEVEEERDCLALIVQSSQRKQLNPIIHQSKMPTKPTLREKSVRFHDLAFKEIIIITSKSADGQVK